MTPRERDHVAGLCATLAGLNIETDRGYLLESGLGVVARREGYGSIAELVRSVRDRGDQRLVWEVVEALAPAHTAFFRDPEVFAALGEHLEAAAARGAVRVWSAACGSGQEIYSIAMLLEERGVDGVELFASDLSQRSVEKARVGLYSQFEVQQGLSARRLVRHFANVEDEFLLDPEIRRQVKWRRLNLLDVAPGVGTFDVILCRHLLGSLLPPAGERVMAHLTAALRPGGQLVLGAGEAPPTSLGLVPVAGAPGRFEIPERVRAAA
ncbi:CheR family methyltransferase [Phenylobacterium sp.]|uniref:CheR family methyltransferase n=1 Tax=Phenylobacterium sp. TaxID=1871053 RepID=UPI002DF2A33E|nr:CheR family methyltransferase [Phenylobacterium sp.]